jgi:hypothetical protein
MASFVCPGYLIKDPLKGFDITKNFPKTITSVGCEFKYELWSNELGCFDLPYKGEKDYILLVGDSFTFGCAPLQRKWGFMLENTLGSRVIKCGVVDYGTRQEFLKAKEIISRISISPKLIILGYCTNDIANDYRLYRQMGNAGFKDSPTISGSYRFLLQSIVEAIRRFIWNRPYLRDFVRERLSPLFLRIPCLRVPMLELKAVSMNDLAYYGYPEFAFIWQQHLSNLRDFKELAAAQGAGLLIVMIPEKEQVYRFLTKWRFNPEGPNKSLRAFFKEEGISFIDLLPEFKKRSDQRPRRHLDSGRDLYLRYDNHWNFKGEYLAALLVLQYVLENNLIYVQDRNKKLRDIRDKLADFR